MKIQDIIGKHVKVSKSTITVLNDIGKTAGMITGVDTFYSMPTREQFEHAIRKKEERENEIYFIRVGVD